MPSAEVVPLISPKASSQWLHWWCSPAAVATPIRTVWASLWLFAPLGMAIIRTFSGEIAEPAFGLKCEPYEMEGMFVGDVLLYAIDHSSNRTALAARCDRHKEHLGLLVGPQAPQPAAA